MATVRQPLRDSHPTFPTTVNPVNSQPHKGSHKALSAASNLANLLPTGTVLAFQALIPSFTNDGKCVLAHKYLTLAFILFCSLACFLSSFTDSFVTDGKLYYGIAIRSGLYVFNDDLGNRPDPEKMRNYRLTPIDFVHAFASLVVFLVVSISSSNVQDCFFPKPGPNQRALITNLPLGAGLLASILFTLFPTERRGIGYGDMTPGARTADHEKKEEEPKKEVDTTNNSV